MNDLQRRALSRAVLAGACAFALGSMVVYVSSVDFVRTQTVTVTKLKPSPSPVYVEKAVKEYVPVYRVVTPSPVIVYVTDTATPEPVVTQGSGGEGACAQAVRAAQQAIDAVGTDGFQAAAANFELYRDLCM